MYPPLQVQERSCLPHWSGLPEKGGCGPIVMGIQDLMDIVLMDIVLGHNGIHIHMGDMLKGG
jgi:hypothetical protein